MEPKQPDWQTDRRKLKLMANNAAIDLMNAGYGRLNIEDLLKKYVEDISLQNIIDTYLFEGIDGN